MEKHNWFLFLQGWNRHSIPSGHFLKNLSQEEAEQKSKEIIFDNFLGDGTFVIDYKNE